MEFSEFFGAQSDQPHGALWERVMDVQVVRKEEREAPGRVGRRQGEGFEDSRTAQD